MTVVNISANKITTIPKQCHPVAITQMVMDGLRCPLGDATLARIFNLFQSVRPLVRGIKNGHFIRRRNDVTANGRQVV